MRYPMNEYVTDLKKAAEVAQKVLPSSPNVFGSASAEACSEDSADRERARETYGKARKCGGTKAEAIRHHYL